MELTLSGCSITHIPKDGKKKKHELKIVHQGADPLVLAVQSKEQAEEWLKVNAINPKKPHQILSLSVKLVLLPFIVVVLLIEAHVIKSSQLFIPI